MFTVHHVDHSKIVNNSLLSTTITDYMFNPTREVALMLMRQRAIVKVADVVAASPNDAMRMTTHIGSNWANHTSVTPVKSTNRSTDNGDVIISSDYQMWLVVDRRLVSIDHDHLPQNVDLPAVV